MKSANEIKQNAIDLAELLKSMDQRQKDNFMGILMGIKIMIPDEKDQNTSSRQPPQNCA